MSDLAQYLEEIVEPTIKDFEQNPTSRRHAFLTCVAIYHGVDYLAYPHETAASLRQQFKHRSVAFKIVDDVGQTFKHVIQGKRSEPRMKASEVISRPPAAFDVGAWDLSRWDDPIGGATLDSDRNVDILEAAKSATAFLWAQIKGPEGQFS